jgi:hypothetical protein
MRHNMLVGLALAGLASSGLSLSASGTDIMSDDEGLPRKPRPQPKRRNARPEPKPDHPAMPEGGWPESRQVRRARERRSKETSDAE